ASVERGHQVFLKAGCIGCHTDYGRQTPYLYDKWGTLARPLNLTTNTYRGGRRPIDILYRIKGGIDPSGMPKVGGSLDVKKPDPNNPKNEIVDVEATNLAHWDLVNFVRALPYPQMLPDNVRKAVYGASELKARQERRASAD